jgi:hypothetical protein
MAHLLGDMTNDIYDAHSTSADLAFAEGLGPYNLFIGVMVSLMPRVKGL